MIGGDLVGLERVNEAACEIQSAVTDVNRLRDADRASVARFEALITKYDTDWNAKIDGFEAKAALKESRTFRQAHANEHITLTATHEHAGFNRAWGLWRS